MKKYLLLFVMLVPVIMLSQGLPTANNIGFSSSKHFDVPSGNRSVPPGTLVWSQLPLCDNAYACQSDVVYPFDAQSADDFMFDVAPGQITAVRWWTIWWNPETYSAPASFNIIIYSDNSCSPGSIAGTWSIPFANANEDAGCSVYFPSREYWATLNPPFVPVSGQHYWIVTQPVMTFPPQTGTTSAVTDNLCTAKQNFPLIGIYWADLATDLAFELYSGDAPPLETPVSSWALVLGGVLIAAAVFMRYRRIS